MNATIRSYGVEAADNGTPRTKTLDLWFTVTDQHLEDKVKRAFDLAKTAGQELDVTFSLKTS
jgi:hypothetical protein